MKKAVSIVLDMRKCPRSIKALLRVLTMSMMGVCGKREAGLISSIPRAPIGLLSASALAVAVAARVLRAAVPVARVRRVPAVRVRRAPVAAVAQIVCLGPAVPVSGTERYTTAVERSSALVRHVIPAIPPMNAWGRVPTTHTPPTALPIRRQALGERPSTR